MLGWVCEDWVVPLSEMQCKELTFQVCNACESPVISRCWLVWQW